MLIRLSWLSLDTLDKSRYEAEHGYPRGLKNSSACRRHPRHGENRGRFTRLLWLIDYGQETGTEARRIPTRRIRGALLHSQRSLFVTGTSPVSSRHLTSPSRCALSWRKWRKAVAESRGRLRSGWSLCTTIIQYRRVGKQSLTHSYEPLSRNCRVLSYGCQL